MEGTNNSILLSILLNEQYFLISKLRAIYVIYFFPVIYLFIYVIKLFYQLYKVCFKRKFITIGHCSSDLTGSLLKFN